MERPPKFYKITFPQQAVQPPGLQGQKDVNASIKSDLEIITETFVIIQTKQNDEFNNHNLHANEIHRQLESKIDSIYIHNKILETQISQVEQQQASSSKHP